MSPLKDMLDLGPQEIVSFIGGGGKTTAMFTLALELSTQERVLVTTTTKINYPSTSKVVITNNLEDALLKAARCTQPGMTVLGYGVKDGKIQGIPTAWIKELKRHFPYILIEADGASRKPLKAHAAWEPVIPDSSTVVVVVTGVSVIGQPLDDEHVHRAQLFSGVTGYPLGERVTPWLVARSNEEMVRLTGLQAPGARNIGLLNQITSEQEADYLPLAKYLRANCYQHVLMGSLLPAVRLRKITSAESVPVATIVLAAGSSRRMGAKNKLLLPWKGKSIIRHAVENIMQAGSQEIIVVVGYQEQLVRHELDDLDVRFTYNELFAEGQASSVRKGLECLEGNFLGAMFVLGDQPFIPSGLISTLISAFKLENPPAAYPIFQGKRGNPVIFHRNLFPSLSSLTGDNGGRGLLQELSSKALRIPCATPAVLKDIDTPEDWDYLSNQQ